MDKNALYTDHPVKIKLIKSETEEISSKIDYENIARGLGDILHSILYILDKSRGVSDPTECLTYVVMLSVQAISLITGPIQDI